MIANYHTHTVRCRHASGTEEAYVQEAVKGGLKILGFSDHTPYFFPGNYYSTMRMYPNELEDYVSSVLRLREKYAGQIEILLGLETEYYPALFDSLLPVLRGAGIAYLILGQHWCGNEIGETYTYRPTADTQQLQRYCDQVIEAMDTGLFTYIAHPDILNYTGESSEYAYHMRRLCEAAKAKNVPLEINLLGLRTRRNYPNELFWQIAGETGCQAILGSDAHAPQDVVREDTIAEALALVEKFGLPLLDTVPLRGL